MNIKQKEKLLFYGSFLIYIIPVLIFGDVMKLYQILSIPISLVFLYWNIKRNLKWHGVIDGVILGIFTTIFKLHPFSIHLTKSIVELGFSYTNIVGYWVVVIGYISLSSISIN